MRCLKINTSRLNLVTGGIVLGKFSQFVEIEDGSKGLAILSEKKNVLSL